MQENSSFLVNRKSVFTMANEKIVPPSIKIWNDTLGTIWMLHASIPIKSTIFLCSIIRLFKICTTKGGLLICAEIVQECWAEITLMPLQAYFTH